MPDPAAPTREQVFAWMAETGSTIAQASAHFGVPAGTIKSWRSRNPGEAPPLAQPQPRTQPPPPLAPARVAPSPPAPKPRKSTAADLPPDDRAELVALVRELRALLISFKDERRSELEKRSNGGSPDSRRLAELSQAARSTAAEIDSLLRAHPGLMAIVESDNTTDSGAAADQIEGFLARLANR